MSIVTVVSYFEKRLSERGSLPKIGRRALRDGFSLLEVLFAMAIVGTLVVALYAAIGTATNWVRLCQENERVTQIMSEKMDTIRLYNWDQVNSNGFIATNFIVGIDPLNTNSTPYYTGTVTIARNPVTEPYGTNLVQVTVEMSWLSGRLAQHRDMNTLVTRWGLQSYVIH